MSEVNKLFKVGSASFRFVIAGSALAAALAGLGCEGSIEGPSATKAAPPTTVVTASAEATANFGVATWKYGSRGLMAGLDAKGARVVDLRFRSLPNKSGIEIRELFPARGLIRISVDGTRTVVHPISPAAQAVLGQAVADLKNQPVAYGCYGSFAAMLVTCTAATIEGYLNPIVDAACIAAVINDWENCNLIGDPSSGPGNTGSEDEPVGGFGLWSES